MQISLADAEVQHNTHVNAVVQVNPAGLRAPNQEFTSILFSLFCRFMLVFIVE
jgi:hypothetical protein